MSSLAWNFLLISAQRYKTHHEHQLVSQDVPLRLHHGWYIYHRSHMTAMHASGVNCMTIDTISWCHIHSLTLMTGSIRLDEHITTGRTDELPSALFRLINTLTLSLVLSIMISRRDWDTWPTREGRPTNGRFLYHSPESLTRGRMSPALSCTSFWSFFTSAENHPAWRDSLSASAVVFNFPPVMWPECVCVFLSECECMYECAHVLRETCLSVWTSPTYENWIQLLQGLWVQSALQPLQALLS